MNAYPLNEEQIQGQLTAENRHLRTWLHQLEALLALPQGQVPTAEQMNKLHRQFAALQGALAEHYRQEVEDGLLEEAVVQRPSIGPQVKALIQDQAPLLKEVERLMVYCQAGTLSAELWSMLQEQTVALIKKLAEHERISNCLVQKGFNFDCQDLLE